MPTNILLLLTRWLSCHWDVWCEVSLHVLTIPELMSVEPAREYDDVNTPVDTTTRDGVQLRNHCYHELGSHVMRQIQKG